MLVRFLRIPNVHFARTFHFCARASQALAQAATAEPQHIPISTLSTTGISNQFTTHITTAMETDILPVDPSRLGKISFEPTPGGLIEEWNVRYEEGNDLDSLRRAANELATTNVPVAFPTETVYGLGGDATRSSATRSIFAAKGRPADNPLIVHVHSVSQLRGLLRGKDGVENGTDPIPEIYKPLIRKFWPGPLTLIMPVPENSTLAPEVTAGLNTFGARMPRSILALALIRLAGVPLAAPSANASTRPSPTAAEHVKDDLNGRIHTIIDGGPCEVGVESTVVDGLSHPPTILRPGGVTVEQLRTCPGWEDVVVGYKDVHEKGIRPKAPGMKYRHYSPKASVVLHEAGANAPDMLRIAAAKGYQSVGIVRTKHWPTALNLPIEQESSSAKLSNGMNGQQSSSHLASSLNIDPASTSSNSNLLLSLIQHQVPHAKHYTLKADLPRPVSIWDIHLGANTQAVARGLFSALREVDKKGVDAIYVEGIDDKKGDDIAAAVMNRLRKAAEIRV